MVKTLQKLIAYPTRLIFGNGYKALQAMGKQIDDLGGLTFNIKLDEDGWIARCEEIPGLFTGGEHPVTKDKINTQIKDAIFSAFNVPFFMVDHSLLANKEELIKNLKNRSQGSQTTERFVWGSDSLWQTT